MLKAIAAFITDTKFIHILLFNTFKIKLVPFLQA